MKNYRIKIKGSSFKVTNFATRKDNSGNDRIDIVLQQDKDTYILYLLTIPEQDRTSIDKHILKFNTIKVKPENILVEN